jgi:hypothetical protein
MRKQYNLMDLLILSAPCNQLFKPRSIIKIQNDIQENLNYNIKLEEKKIKNISENGFFSLVKKKDNVTFIELTEEGLKKYFQTKYELDYDFRNGKPFANEILIELSHWFDEFFSPKSNMNKKLEELNLPGSLLGDGTKWRETEVIFIKWNCKGKLPYFSHFLSKMLIPEQWPNKDEKRYNAWERINSIFKNANLKLSPKGILISILENESFEPKTDIWNESEEIFSKNFIEPLLKRILDLIDVIYTHGNEEYGRDFIYSYNHPILNEKRWGAIQIKMGNVSGEAGGDFQTILDQISMCFRHPSLNITTSQQITISEVILLISGKFTKNAKERIINELHDPVWKVNTFFLEKSSLENLFRNFFQK